MEDWDCNELRLALYEEESVTVVTGESDDIGEDLAVWCWECEADFDDIGQIMVWSLRQLVL